MWASTGHEVTVVTGFPSHPTGIVPAEYKGKWIQEEITGGIRIIRTKKFNTPNRGIFLRLLNHFSMAVSTFIVTVFDRSYYDAVICSSPPLFIGLSALLLKFIKRTPFVFEARDLWPQQAIDLGIIKSKIAIYFSRALENSLYRNAEHIVVVAKGSVDELSRRGIDPEKISLVRNGVLLHNFDEPPDIRHELSFREKFIISYIGTFGASQGLMTLLTAAKPLKERGREDIHFLLVGDGVERESLSEFQNHAGLTNVTIMSAQPFERVPAIYKASDILVVSLRKVPLFARTIPSKLYEAMAASVPVLGLVEGECGTIIQEAGCGFIVEPENSIALANEIERISAIPKGQLASLGKCGRRWVEKNAERSLLARDYLEILKGCVLARPAPNSKNTSHANDLRISDTGASHIEK